MLLLGLVLEGGLGGDSLDQCLLIGGGSTKLLLHDVLPGTGLLEDILLNVVEEANVDKDLDELGETGIAESTTRWMSDMGQEAEGYVICTGR